MCIFRLVCDIALTLDLCISGLGGWRCAGTGWFLRETKVVSPCAGEGVSVRSVLVFVDPRFCVGRDVGTCVLESMMWMSSRVRCDCAIWVHVAFAGG